MLVSLYSCCSILYKTNDYIPGFTSNMAMRVCGSYRYHTSVWYLVPGTCPIVYTSRYSIVGNDEMVCEYSIPWYSHLCSWLRGVFHRYQAFVVLCNTGNEMAMTSLFSIDCAIESSLRLIDGGTLLSVKSSLENWDSIYPNI